MPIESKHEAAAEILCETFRREGGIYTKFGQIIATLEVIVPDEYRQKLSKLYMDCMQTDYSSVAKRIESEFGRPVSSIFKEFSEKPISSASIAQVHRAKLKETGQDVAVKVQHDWVQKSLPIDLCLIELFVKVGEQVFPEFSFNWFVNELRVNIWKETNFHLEKQNILKTANYFKNKNYVVVPLPIEGLCSQKVLTMQFIEGMSINDVDKLEKEGFDLHLLTKNLAKLYAKQIFQFGFVHADPHPGNIHVRKIQGKDGKEIEQIVLYDHGLYKEISPELKMW